MSHQRKAGSGSYENSLDDDDEDGEQDEEDELHVDLSMGFSQQSEATQQDQYGLDSVASLQPRRRRKR